MKKQLAILLMISLLMGAAAETSQRDEHAATLAARMVHMAGRAGSAGHADGSES